MTNSNNNTFLFISSFYALALIGYNAVGPLLTAFFSAGSAASIVIIRGAILLFALWAIFFVRTKRIPNLYLFLFPLLLFRFAFLFRLIENAYLQNVGIYIDGSIAFFVFFGFGLVPAITAAKFSVHIRSDYFAKTMNVLLVIFVIGLIFNYQSLFNTTLTRVGLYRLNAITLTSTALTFLVYLIIFGRKDSFIKKLTFVTAPLLIAATIVSNSRGPLVGVVFAFAVYFILSKAANRKSFLYGLLVLGALGLVGSVLFDFDVSAVLDRFFISSGYNSDLDLSGNNRLIFWNSAWNQFLDDPVFGRYIFVELTSWYPHNLFLESLISLGVLGGFLFFIFLISVFIAAVRVVKSNYSSKVALFSVVIFFKEIMEGMFSGNLIGSAEIWITAAYIVSISIVYRLYKPTESRISKRNLSPSRKEQIPI